MIVSATYICPVRGVATLEAPHPERLLKAAKTGRDLGVERLLLPVLEESLSGNTRSRVRFLDDMILALDRVSEAGLTCWLIAPASHVLSLRFAPPYLLRGNRDPKAPPVFVDGALRNLFPLNWWIDPAVIQMRIRLFRELLSAVAGHPCLTGWVLLDRAFEMMRPRPDAADFVLRSLIAEIRERDEAAKVHLGLAWSDMVLPETALSVAPLVDGIRMAAGEKAIPSLPSPSSLADELLFCSFLAAVGGWVLGKPVEMEVGTGLLIGPGDQDILLRNLVCLAGYGASSLSWMTLVDPVPRIQNGIPWVLKPGLSKLGLFHPDLEPRRHAEEWIGTARKTEPGGRSLDFIDLGREEYLSDPSMHIARMWDHFQESTS